MSAPAQLIGRTFDYEFKVFAKSLSYLLFALFFGQ